MKWCRNGTRRSCSTCGCCSTFQSASLAMKLDEGLLHRFCQISSKAVKWFCLLVSNDWHKPQREHKKRKCRTWKLCVLVPRRCIFLGLAGMCRKAFWLGAPWQNSATGIKKSAFAWGEVGNIWKGSACEQVGQAEKVGVPKTKSEPTSPNLQVIAYLCLGFFFPSASIVCQCRKYINLVWGSNRRSRMYN